MARVTIEDCLENVNNRFELVHLAVSRVRQLNEGSKARVHCDNKEVVVALREIAAAQVSKQEAVIEEEDELKLQIDFDDLNIG